MKFVCKVKKKEQNEQRKYRKMIPKIIHYCWFGRNPLPESALKCIASWRKFLPDYEIREWNEDNFDVNIIPYTQQAYEAKKWGFVTDYARLETVYKYGGIYFDTDVELIKPIDDLLYNYAFFGFGNYGRVATGLGFGAIKAHGAIETLMNVYNDISLYKEDGSIDISTNTMHEESAFLKMGLTPDDSFQRRGSIVFLTSDFLSPLVPGFNKPRITENTMSIHHNQFSWGNPDELESVKDSERAVVRIRNRFKR